MSECRWWNLLYVAACVLGSFLGMLCRPPGITTLPPSEPVTERLLIVGWGADGTIAAIDPSDPYGPFFWIKAAEMAERIKLPATLSYPAEKIDR